MKISDVLTILKIILSLLLVPLAVLLGGIVHHLTDVTNRAEFTFDVPISTAMSNFGTFFLVSMLLLIAGWGLLTTILPRLVETSSSARLRELRIIISFVLLILLIGMAIVANYFVQEIFLLSF